MLRKLSLQLLVLSFFSSYVISFGMTEEKDISKSAADDIVISIDTLIFKTDITTSISVPVKVKNFSAIGSITLKIKYAPRSLMFKGLSNVSGISNPMSNSRDGIITIAWFDASGSTGIQVPDGVIFNLDFNFNGPNSKIDFISEQCEVTDSKAIPYKVIFNNGIVKHFPSDVEKSDSKLNGYNLEQNYPNPFNPSTTICYSLNKASFVRLKIFDLMGQEIATLVNKFSNSGNYSVSFNGSNLSSGTYFYRLEAGGNVLIKKMILTK